jgi:hypothetical protein
MNKNQLNKATSFYDERELKVDSKIQIFQQPGFLFTVIQGHSSLISQFLHPTNFEIRGMIINPITQKIIVRTSTFTE